MRITPQALKTACASSQHVIETAEAIEVDPLLLASLIFHESRWQKSAVSNKKACGLTQVLSKVQPFIVLLGPVLLGQLMQFTILINSDTKVLFAIYLSKSSNSAVSIVTERLFLSN